MLGIFLDTETTGLNPFKHVTLEIALEIVDLLTGNTLDTYDSILRISPTDWEAADTESLRVNGFIPADTEKGNLPETVCQEITDLLNTRSVRRGNSVFICQNPSFDRAFFTKIVPIDIQEKYAWPYHWLDLASMHWAVMLNKRRDNAEAPLPKIGELSKDAIARTYGIPKENTPHRARSGVEHLLACYTKVVGFPLQ